MGFPSPGIFGHCSNQNYLKFMNNLETNSCVVKEVDKIDEKACDATSFNNFGQIEILSGDGISIIKPTVGNVRKFSVLTFKEEDLTGNDQYRNNFMDATYDDATDSCDNFVLEMHYKVYFKAATEDQEFADPTIY